MAKKYVSLEKLQTFLDNLRSQFATITHKHTISDITDYTVDAELSSTSINPVQNRVLDAEFEAMANAMNALENAIDGKASDTHNHDDVYYTESEIDAKILDLNSAINGKSDNGHNHDDMYYTEAEINAALAKKSDSTHNHDSDYDSKGSADTALDQAKSYTESAVSGLASTSSVNTSISTHNTSTSAHSDIRALISDLSTAVNNFLDVDDTTTDQLSEVLTLINNNKGTLESLTSGKINVSDIVNNLTTNSSSKVLSAAQGVAIKGLIDTLQGVVDGKADEEHSHTITAGASDDDVVVLTGTNGTNGVTYSASHANSGVTAGTYKSVTVDAKGHVTGGSNPTTLSGYGITNAYTKTQVDSALATKSSVQICIWEAYD